MVKLIGSGMCLTCLLYAAGVFAYFNIYFFSTQFNAIFLAAVLVLVFLLVPASKDAKSKDRLPWYDIFFAGASLAGCLYIAINAVALAGAIKLTATPLEIVLGLITVVLILEAVRRILGWPMVVIGLIFFLYIKFGYLVPGAFGSYPENWAMVLADVYISTQGIFGHILDIARSIVITFIVFGIFFIRVGGGKFFMNVALSLTGSRRGGPAKAAVLGSALFGTISGSPVANVVVTGSITIPMMKRVGYEPHFAGAVESVASTGGNIMPPIMGVVAFIMATMINVPYTTIAIAATLPAILYFFAVYMQVDLHAAKAGIRGLPRYQLPKLALEFKSNWELMIPLVVLVMLIFVLRLPLAMSGAYTILALLLVSLFRKQHRLGIKDFIECLEDGFRSALSVSVLMALAGIILAALVVTGLGPRISAGLVALAGNNLLLLVLLTAVACYVMGMGVSILGSYILLAALVGPALVSFGIPVMAAHFFILYMITSGFFTPPLCPVAFVAAPIAGATPFRIGFTAMRLGIVAFLVPFIIVYNPALILVGELGDIIVAALTALIGVFALSVGLEGYLFRRINLLQRLFLLGSSIFMIIPGTLTDSIGASIIAMIIAWHWRDSRKVIVPLQSKQAS